MRLPKVLAAPNAFRGGAERERERAALSTYFLPTFSHHTDFGFLQRLGGPNTFMLYKVLNDGESSHTLHKDQDLGRNFAQRQAAPAP